MEIILRQIHKNKTPVQANRFILSKLYIITNFIEKTVINQRFPDPDELFFRVRHTY